MSFSLAAAKMFKGLGAKRRESSDGDRVYMCCQASWMARRSAKSQRQMTRMSWSFVITITITAIKAIAITITITAIITSITITAIKVVHRSN